MICTVDELQKYSGVYVDDTSSQEMFLGAAQGIVENYLGYEIEQRTYMRLYSGLDFADLRLGVKNVTEVARLTINGAEVSADRISIDDDAVILKSGVFTAGTKNVYAEFTAGYGAESVPELMKLTVLRIAALLQSESDSNIGITSKSFGDAGTRVFQNYTNFDKYLLPLSRYKLLA